MIDMAKKLNFYAWDKIDPGWSYILWPEGWSVTRYNSYKNSLYTRSYGYELCLFNSSIIKLYTRTLILSKMYEGTVYSPIYEFTIVITRLRNKTYQHISI